MQKCVPTYFKDSNHLRALLKKLQKTGLLDLDSIGIYPNMDTKHDLQIIKAWFLDSQLKI